MKLATSHIRNRRITPYQRFIFVPHIHHKSLHSFHCASIKFLVITFPSSDIYRINDEIPIIKLLIPGVFTKYLMYSNVTFSTWPFPFYTTHSKYLAKLSQRLTIKIILPRIVKWTAVRIPVSITYRNSYCKYHVKWTPVSITYRNSFHNCPHPSGMEWRTVFLQCAISDLPGWPLYWNDR